MLTMFENGAIRNAAEIISRAEKVLKLCEEGAEMRGLDISKDAEKIAYIICNWDREPRPLLIAEVDKIHTELSLLVAKYI